MGITLFCGTLPFMDWVLSSQNEKSHVWRNLECFLGFSKVQSSATTRNWMLTNWKLVSFHKTETLTLLSHRPSESSFSCAVKTPLLTNLLKKMCQKYLRSHLKWKTLRSCTTACLQHYKALLPQHDGDGDDNQSYTYCN